MEIHANFKSGKKNFHQNSYEFKSNQQPVSCPKEKHKKIEWTPKGYPWQNIKWRATTINVDIETAELLTTKHIQNGKYIKITTTKDYTISKDTPTGTIEYTTLWRKNPQLRLL